MYIRALNLLGVPIIHLNIKSKYIFLLSRTIPLQSLSVKPTKTTNLLRFFINSIACPSQYQKQTNKKTKIKPWALLLYDMSHGTLVGHIYTHTYAQRYIYKHTGTYTYVHIHMRTYTHTFSLEKYTLS